MHIEEVLSELNRLGNEQVALRKQADFGIPALDALGIYMKDLNLLAKTIGKDSDLAFRLIDSGTYEARLLGAKICRYQDVESQHMDEWVLFFNTWEICDTYCMQLFKYCDHSWMKIESWSRSEAEYIKRAAYVIMATYGQGHKELPNEAYDGCAALILRDATDERNFVKKAVNWAIREIGKRNQDLRESMIDLCHQLLMKDSKSARWIANGALRELENCKVRIRDYPRSVYRV